MLRVAVSITPWNRNLGKSNWIPKAFSPKRGLVFTVNGPRHPPLPTPKFPVDTPGPSPPLLLKGVLLKIPGGGGGLPESGEGGGGRIWGWGKGGGAEAPFTVETSPLFGENAFQLGA